MANFLEKVNYSTMSMPKAMNRTNPAPLDASAIWTSLEELRNYAATSAVAYVGQILSLVAYDAETGEISEVKAYIIKDAAGNIEEVGSATLGDNKSIELNGGVLSVKDFGKRFYKYIAATETEEAKYELVEVSESNPWKAGLQPRIDAEGNIGWYEPNPTTIEGVQDQVIGIQGDVEQAQQDIDAVEENLVKAEEKIDSINDTLYGTEGEEAVKGLVDKVADLEAHATDTDKEITDLWDAVDDTYTKEEVDGLVSGVFHYKGIHEGAYDDLPSLTAKVGDVWQIGDKEYAWNGEAWVELGFTIDLSAYATKEYVNTEVKKVQDEVDAVEGRLDGHDTAIEGINGRLDGHDTAIEEAEGRLDTVEGKVETLEQAKETADTQFETINGKIETLEQANETAGTQFETVNGKIEALEDADEALDTRVGDLEAYLGTPATLETALFPAVEALQQRIEGLVAVGGEANLINGLTINGAALVPNAEKIIDLPIFSGTTAGLVPVVGEAVVKATSFLSAEGSWIDVAAMIDDKIDEALVWEEIEVSV